MLKWQKSRHVVPRSLILRLFFFITCIPLFTFPLLAPFHPLAASSFIHFVENATYLNQQTYSIMKESEEKVDIVHAIMIQMSLFTLFNTVFIYITTSTVFFFIPYMFPHVRWHPERRGMWLSAHLLLCHFLWFGEWKTRKVHLIFFPVIGWRTDGWRG